MSDAAERPVAIPGIEIAEAADGYVVYDEQRDRVHYLNHTAALILELCSGENSVGDIVGLLQSAYELSEPPDSETRACLENLRREGLLAGASEGQE